MESSHEKHRQTRNHFVYAKKYNKQICRIIKPVWFSGIESENLHTKPILITMVPAFQTALAIAHEFHRSVLKFREPKLKVILCSLQTLYAIVSTVVCP